MTNMKNLVVTIDGPAGAGKTDTAIEVAKRMNLTHYNSGYSYRAITYALLENNMMNEDLNSEKVRNFVSSLNIKNQGAEVFLDDKNITSFLKTAEAEKHVPTISKIGFIRNKTKEILLAFATSGAGMVVEGRDIGTVVLPNADIKIFLTASLEIRALRRLDQESSMSFEEVYENIKGRDKTDSTREIAPLKQPEDGFVIDNSNLTMKETSEHIVGIVRGKMNIKEIKK